MQTQSGHTYNEMLNGCQYRNNTQETGMPGKYNVSTTGIRNSNNEDKSIVIDEIHCNTNYFIPGCQQADKMVSGEIIQHLHSVM